MQLTGINITPNTALAYKSPTITCESASEIIRFNVTQLAAGQSLQLRVIAIDDGNQGYFHGPARAAVTSAKEYSYSLGSTSGAGGSFPADGQIGLPPPVRYQIWVYAGDTSGTKPATFNLYTEFGSSSSGVLVDEGVIAIGAPINDIAGNAGSGTPITASSLPLPTNAAQETGGILSVIAAGQGTKGNSTFKEGSESTTSSAQAASTTWGMLTTNGGSALGTNRVGVHVANTGSNDIWVGTGSGLPRWIIPAGSDRQIGIAGGITLYFATLNGVSTAYATEYGF